MTASPSLRYPLSNAHNRKRRPALTLQDKPTKPKATTLGFATAIQAASSSVPEMSVDEDKRDESPSCNEQFDSIFRERMSIWAETREDTPDNTEEVEDSWTLKRASPLANDDDADEECMSYESPAKKTKVQTIFWENHLSIEEPFDIVSMMGSL